MSPENNNYKCMVVHRSLETQKIKFNICFQLQPAECLKTSFMQKTAWIAVYGLLYDILI